MRSESAVGLRGGSVGAGLPALRTPPRSHTRHRAPLFEFTQLGAEGLAGFQFPIAQRVLVFRAAPPQLGRRLVEVKDRLRRRSRAQGRLADPGLHGEPVTCHRAGCSPPKTVTLTMPTGTCVSREAPGEQIGQRRKVAVVVRSGVVQLPGTSAAALRGHGLHPKQPDRRKLLARQLATSRPLLPTVLAMTHPRHKARHRRPAHLESLRRFLRRDRHSSAARSWPASRSSRTVHRPDLSATVGDFRLSGRANRHLRTRVAPAPHGHRLVR